MKVQKFIAAQVNPEYQESEFTWMGYEEILTENDIALFGNRWFNEHTDGTTYGEIKSVMDEATEDFDLLNDEPESCYFDNLEDLINYHFKKSSGNYDAAEYDRWRKILSEYSADDRTEENFILAAAELMTGRKYEIITLRGCCQGDWVECCKPVDSIDNDWLEGNYFNTGSEWICYMEPVEIEAGIELDADEINELAENLEDSCSTYSVKWGDDEILEDLANCIGCKPEDVIMVNYEGKVIMENPMILPQVA